MGQHSVPSAIGIDVGGTKCAAGVVDLALGKVLARRVQPTAPQHGGEAVMAIVLDLARSMQDAAKTIGLVPRSIGIGVAELVDRSGAVVSHDTIDWRGIDVHARVKAATGLPMNIDADVRAAARAEARYGAGRGFDNFLYVTVGTGISCALVVDGCPFVGTGGLCGTLASSPGLVPSASGTLVPSQPLESFASGPALVSRLRAIRPDFTATAFEVLALVAEGDHAATEIVESAGSALGSAIAHLVNVLDPAAVVLGGGLGLAGGEYLNSTTSAFRQFIYADSRRSLPLLHAALGGDAGWIGAALSAERECV